MQIQKLICCAFSFCFCFWGIAQTPRGTESSSFNITEVEQQMMKLSDSLYVDQYEVSNEEYLRFLQTNTLNNRTKFAVDSLGWKKCLNNMPELTTYHRHTAFAKYPVVNISYDAAQAYCKWLTDNYNKTSGRKYKEVVFRLPTEVEWEKAARSGKTEGMYAWEGVEIMDGKKSFMCNFGDIFMIHPKQKGKNRREAPPASDHHIIAAPVKSFQPNAMGVYNICGNVAEMTDEKGYTKGGSWYSPREKVEISQFEMFTVSEPFVGFRVFMQIKKM